MTQTTDRRPGGLYLQSSHTEPVGFPLTHTEVHAKVTGNLARVEVTQTFENPFTSTLDAVYIFPLPDEAAVDDMLICIGDRRIQGQIKKREEAQQLYEQAKQQGRTAGLLEQERDNIFTQSLANIQPGESIQVVIRYTDCLKFEAAYYEFVFPMVVGPRYIPGTPIAAQSVSAGSAIAPMTSNQDTDAVPDASRLNAPILPPGMRSRHDISVTLEINAGVVVQDVRSPSHPIQVTTEGQITRVTLAGGATIPNQDLIVRYQVSGDRTHTTVLTQADNRGGHVALYLIPAVHYQPDQLLPKDVVFLIDTSGSQMGDPLLKCQELMRRCINGLHPNDTFNIIDFSNTARQLSPVPLANTPPNRKWAMRYIAQLQAGGGTEMLRGIQAVLNLPVVDPGRLRNIILLTDGYIGDENRILTEVQRHLKPGNRLHSFGAGSSVNRFLLNRVAEMGRGIARIIRQNEPTDTVAEQFFRAINNPVLANIQLRWEGVGDAPLFYPDPVPDLFAEQPLVLFGHKSDRQPGTLHLIGTTAGGQYYQQAFDLTFAETGNLAIAQLWGRARIKALMNQMVSGDTQTGVDAVTATALSYQLLSQYTAFVAISDDVRVDTLQSSISVQVPVEMPEGIHYEGIFGGEMINANRMRRVTFTERISSVAPQSMSAPAPASQEFLPASSLDTVEPADYEPVSEFPRELESFRGEASLPRESPSASLNVPCGLEAEETLRARKQSRLKIASADGLEPAAIALLLRHLQTIHLPDQCSGNLVFKLTLSKKRVKHVILDEQRSSLTDYNVTDAVRQLLLTWQPPTSGDSQVLLTIQIC
jgi:Ca-activated chloride channel family protein